MRYARIETTMADKKKIVNIGFGGQGRHWFREIQNHPDFELTGIIDTDTEMLEHLKEMTAGMVDNDQGYVSIEDCVQFGEKPDVAVIATLINTHHSIVRETMALGINTICEKNLASTIQQGRQMLQCAWIILNSLPQSACRIGLDMVSGQLSNFYVVKNA